MKVKEIVGKFLDRLEDPKSPLHKTLLRWCGVAVLLVIALLLIYSEIFGPVSRGDRATFEFVVTPEDAEGDVGKLLEEAGLVRYAVSFDMAHIISGNAPIRPGGYRVSLGLDAWTVADIFSKRPYLVWVTIPEGYRKEQLGEYLGRELSWSKEDIEKWNNTSSPEGVYFADTYLIPSDQTPQQVQSRLQGRFEDVMAEYIVLAREKGHDWNDIVTLASIIERESARTDKKLVSGILWNRIEREWMLQVDATLQYIKGESGAWWPVPTSEDKFLDSPYNTYDHTGLPPGPIATPSMASIDAALNPDLTNCLYYLHDNRGRIHCTRTYTEHKQNVVRYLR